MSDLKKTPPGKPELDKPVQVHLGDQLRKFYSSIVSEPVPDRLAALLDELEKKERNTPGAGREQS